MRIPTTTARAGKPARGAAWSLNSDVSRRDGWTSADAAGLQIFPGLARADEVYDLHSIDHALRVTLPLTQRAHVYPARHDASAQRAADLPPMGMRLRLKRLGGSGLIPGGCRRSSCGRCSVTD